MFKRVFKTIADAFSIDKEVTLAEEEEGKAKDEPKFKSTIVPNETQERDVYGNAISPSSASKRTAQKKTPPQKKAGRSAPVQQKSAPAPTSQPAPPASQPQEMKTIGGSRQKASRRKPRGKKIQQPGTALEAAASPGTPPPGPASKAPQKAPSSTGKKPVTKPASAPAAATKQAPAPKQEVQQEFLIPENDPYYEEKKREEKIRKLSKEEMQQVCGLLGGTDKEEIRKTLAKLYRRFNRAASSLDAERRKEAEYMLDIIVEMRRKLIG